MLLDYRPFFNGIRWHRFNICTFVVLLFHKTKPTLRCLKQSGPPFLGRSRARHRQALLREAPIFFCPGARHDPCSFGAYQTNERGGNLFRGAARQKKKREAGLKAASKQTLRGYSMAAPLLTPPTPARTSA